MKLRAYILLFIGVLCCQAAWSQVRESVSILGDSYSTFEGFMTPETNEVWYYARHGGNTDVNSVTETWWHQYIANSGYKLCVNNSYSGATIGYTGYDGNDYSPRSFITRSDELGCPDIIFVFGGTNDSWAGEAVGEYKYDNWNKGDFYTFRPAMAYLTDHLLKRYPNTKLYFIINSELREDISSSMKTICQHYGVKYIQLEDIDKMNGHPTIKGHAQIAEQVAKALK